MSADNLIDELENNFYAFDAAQLIEVLREVCSSAQDNVSGGVPNLRADIYYESGPSLAFPPSDAGSVKIDGNRAAVCLSVAGLLGSTTPLPAWFSDYVCRGGAGAEPLRRFLSIMQNRLHTLWVGAYTKNSLWHDGGGAAETIFERMSARSLDDFIDYDLFWLQAFSRKTRSAEDLKSLLKSIWKNIPVRIEENIGRWTTVENRRALGKNLRLDSRAAIGANVFDRTAKFRVALGPLDFNTYITFLPNARNNQLLKNIVLMYINEPLICELEISCEIQNFKQARLGESSGSLGRTVLLGKPKNDDVRIHRYRTVVSQLKNNNNMEGSPRRGGVPSIFISIA